MVSSVRKMINHSEYFSFVCLRLMVAFLLNFSIGCCEAVSGEAAFEEICFVQDAVLAALAFAAVAVHDVSCAAHAGRAMLCVCPRVFGGSLHVRLIADAGFRVSLESVPLKTAMFQLCGEIYLWTIFKRGFVKAIMKKS